MWGLVLMPQLLLWFVDSHGLKHYFPLAKPLRPSAFKVGDTPWPLQRLHPLISAGHGLHPAEMKENPSLRSGKEHPMRLASRKSLFRQWWRLAGCNHLLWMPARTLNAADTRGALQSKHHSEHSTHPCTAAGPCWVFLASRKAVRKERGLLS